MSDFSKWWYQNVFDTHHDEDSGGGGNMSNNTSGGLNPEDLKMKKLLYAKLKPLLDKGYTKYEGDMFSDREQGELDLLENLKGGGGYKPFYDQASTDLGFSKGVYKTGAEYGTSDLDKDASALMQGGSAYRQNVADQVLSDMSKGASMQGMNITANALGSGAFGGDRAMLAQGLNQQNYLSAAGKQLGNMNMQAYNQALGQARGLNQDRMNAAGGYSDTVLKNLGIDTQSLDKRYATQLGAYKQDRGYKDRDLKQDYKFWSDEQNWPYKNLQYAQGIYSGMPFEEKVSTTQPSSGGK
mgnify:CR=1 FL=1